MVIVSGACKTFGPTTALHDVSFRLEPGDVVGFLGRNGAGKTTAMRLVTGYFAPTSGSISVGGHDVLDDPVGAKACVGYLPESPPLHLEMRVDAYLRFCARLRGLRGAAVDERLACVAAQCGIADVTHRIIGRLSKGYRQRVGIAQALVHDPPILVLDEPTTALDPGQIHEIRALIRDLADEDWTPATPEGGTKRRRIIILSTHRLDDVTATCRRVIVISRGRIVADDTIESLTRGTSLEARFLALTAGEPGGAA